MRDMLSYDGCISRNFRRVFWSLALGLLVLATPVEAQVPVPEFYGIYFVSDGKLIGARNATDERRTKIVASTGGGIIGVTSLSGLNLSPKTYVLAYGPEVGPNLGGLRLRRLVYVETIPDQMNIFRMWIPQDILVVNIGPVPKQKDLYRLVPTSPLMEGVYGVFRGPAGDSVAVGDQGMKLTFIADFVIGRARPQ